MSSVAVVYFYVLTLYCFLLSASRYILNVQCLRLYCFGCVSKFIIYVMYQGMYEVFQVVLFMISVAGCLVYVLRVLCVIMIIVFIIF